MSNFNDQNRQFSVNFTNSVLSSFLGYSNSINLDRDSDPVYNTEVFLQSKFDNTLFPWVPTFLLGNLYREPSDSDDDKSPLKLISDEMNYPVYLTSQKPIVVETIGDSFIKLFSRPRITLYNVRLFNKLYIKDLDEILYIGDGIILDSKFNILMCNYLLLEVDSGIIMGSKLVISKSLYGNSNKLSSVFKNRYVPAVLQSQLNYSVIQIRDQQKSVISGDKFIHKNVPVRTHKTVPTYYSPRIRVEIGNDFETKVIKAKKDRNIITDKLNEVCNNALNSSGNSVAKIFSV